MNTTLITLDQDEAKRKLKAYRSRMHKDAEEEYQRLVEVYIYNAAADGYPLIHLSDVINEGGFDQEGRPRLAIARADRKEVECRPGPGHTLLFDCRKSKRFNSGLVRRIEVRPEFHIGWFRSYAMVPMVPADVRPTKGQLRDWFILWEVDEWYEWPREMAPPTDPFLLKHVVGEFYAVLAEWDLTELEKAVMAEFRNR
ncbi:hypothetical protein KOR42_41590 [Thalassoglobus neptunius]|uniref:Uncharacterized protein n=1 Tax=Thalassoglobus neptunius TaxID=1938619 RepID=A0A5C5WAX4_9PLAN|nr:hypothetical protein [Thalassoglobus neptunius]TWT47161.1 hypothetical protein KOR42_41590 [Thalassoglobus neptunius]